MLKDVLYINHINEKIELDKNGIIILDNDLWDFAWKITSKNDRISSFKKGVVSKPIVIAIKCDTEADGIRQRNRFFEIPEKDVLANKHGKLIIGDYYLRCFVTESSKTEYIEGSNYVRIKLKVSTDFPYWIKETTETFNYGAGSAGTNLDFNRDFPSDYTSNLIGKQLNNTSFVPTNFRIDIYGACENPKVTIAGHDYEVNVTIEANEYLTIDSISKTIVLTHTDGTKENCFKLRNKESYIFEKLPVGISNVSANGDFKFNVTLLEERGEPKWT